MGIMKVIRLKQMSMSGRQGKAMRERTVRETRIEIERLKNKTSSIRVCEIKTTRHEDVERESERVRDKKRMEEEGGENKNQYHRHDVLPLYPRIGAR